MAGRAAQAFCPKLRSEAHEVMLLAMVTQQLASSALCQAEFIHHALSTIPMSSDWSLAKVTSSRPQPPGSKSTCRLRGVYFPLDPEDSIS